MDDTQLVTQKKASELCHVSRTTIIKWRQEGKIPNAEQDQNGTWQIPINDLISLGKLDTVSPSPVESVDLLSNKVKELEHQLAMERQRRETAEQLAMEREIHISDLRQSLKMIEAKPQPTPLVDEKRQGFWSRLFS